MNNKLYIPKKIKVGYQWADDTYSGKLAYIIYYNINNKLAKEKSWLGWIHGDPNKTYDVRDKNGRWSGLKKPGIEPVEYENIPIEGFVLNKKAGDYGSGWNHRQIKCRVWDPRGFEFEITIENLLFILQESNSYKGKGLEGEFIYSWSGKDIVLLPCSGEDYTSSRDFTDMKKMSVHAKTLVPGYTYYSKDQEKVIYIGRYDFIKYSYNSFEIIEKEHIFLFDEKYVNHYFVPINEVKPFNALKVNKLAKIIDENIVPNFSDLVEELENSGLVMPFESITIKDFTNSKSIIIDDPNISYVPHMCLYKKIGENQYETYTLYQQRQYKIIKYDENIVTKTWRTANTYGYVFQFFQLRKNKIKFSIVGNTIKCEEEVNIDIRSKEYTPEEIDAMNFNTIDFKIKNV